MTTTKVNIIRPSAELQSKDVIGGCCPAAERVRLLVSLATSDVEFHQYAYY